MKSFNNYVNYIIHINYINYIINIAIYFPFFISINRTLQKIRMDQEVAIAVPK